MQVLKPFLKMTNQSFFAPYIPSLHHFHDAKHFLCRSCRYFFKFFAFPRPTSLIHIFKFKKTKCAKNSFRPLKMKILIINNSIN